MEPNKAILYAYILDRYKEYDLKPVSITDSHLTIDDALKAMDALDEVHRRMTKDLQDKHDIAISLLNRFVNDPGLLQEARDFIIQIKS